MPQYRTHYLLWSLLLLVVSSTVVVLGTLRMRALYDLYDLEVTSWTEQVLSPWYQATVIGVAALAFVCQVRPPRRLRYFPSAASLLLVTGGLLVCLTVGLLLPLIFIDDGLP